VVIGQPLPVEGSDFVVDLLTKSFAKHFGATWSFEPDPIAAAHLMIDHIDRKRLALGLPPPMYEVPYAPKTVEAPKPSNPLSVDQSEFLEGNELTPSHPCIQVVGDLRGDRPHV